MVKETDRERLRDIRSLLKKMRAALDPRLSKPAEQHLETATQLIRILDAAKVDDVANAVRMLEGMGLTKDRKRVNQDDAVFVVSGRNIDMVLAGSCNVGQGGRLNRGEGHTTGSGNSVVFNWEVYSTEARAAKETA